MPQARYGDPRAAASTSQPGEMSAADKTKLDGITQATDAKLAALGAGAVPAWNGVALAPSGEVYFWPTGGDDGAALTALIAAEYGTGGQRRAIRLLPLAYAATSAVEVLSGLRLYGAEGTTWTATIPWSVTPPPLTDSAFYANYSYSLAQLTAASAPVLGESHIHVTDVVGALATLEEGDTIRIAHLADPTKGWDIASYKVLDISGAAPNITLTLDRPIVRPQLCIAAPRIDIEKGHVEDIVIDGGGMLVEGVASRFFELPVAHGIVRNIRMDQSQLYDVAGSFDTGSHHCLVENVRGFGGTQTAGYGGCTWILEQNESSTIRDCDSWLGRWGFGCSNDWGSTIADCTAEGMTYAGYKTWNETADASGCHHATFERCKAIAAGAGFIISGPTESVRVISPVTQKSAGSGITTHNGSAVFQALDLKISHWRSMDDGRAFYAAPSTVGGLTSTVTIEDPYIRQTGAQTECIYQSGGSLTIVRPDIATVCAPFITTGFTHVVRGGVVSTSITNYGNTSACLWEDLTFNKTGAYNYAFSGANMTCRRCTIAITSATVGILINTPQVAVFEDCTITQPAGTLIWAGTGSITLRRCSVTAPTACQVGDVGGYMEIDGGTMTGNAAVAAGGLLKLAGSPTITGTLTVNAAGFCNRGAIALNETTPVTYPWARIKATDRVSVRRSVAGGTPAEFTAAVSAGVGVVLTGAAGDTSTIAVEIG